MPAWANSGVVVPQCMIAPASSNRWTVGAVAIGSIVSIDLRSESGDLTLDWMKILDRDGHALERARLAAAASVLRLGSLGLFQRSIKIGVGECVDFRLELLASCDDGFEKLDRRKSARLERGNCLRCRHVTEIEIEIAHLSSHLSACDGEARCATGSDACRAKAWPARRRARPGRSSPRRTACPRFAIPPAVRRYRNRRAPGSPESR
jgi:hypothetical protein